FFFSRRRRHTSWPRDWGSDVCPSDPSPPAAGCRTEMKMRPLPLLLLLACTATARAAELKVESTQLQRDDGKGEPGEVVTGFHTKIGRASCRERGRGCGGEGGVEEVSG